MESILETIKKRYSVRNYSSKAIPDDELQRISDYLANIKKGPLGNEVRFEVVDATGYEQAELKALGTYGFIKGPRVFIAGAVKKNEGSMEDFGYCMEKAVLMATSLGFGTCWLGGSLNRSVFAKKINAWEGELIPAVTPIGYALEKRTLTESLVRMVAGADKRKKPEELFFSNSTSTPLDMNNCGQYSKVLEAVRLAPSASNRQPWRIIKDKGDIYHLFMKENSMYNNIYKDIKLQNLDMGIAMCHFELAAAESGLKGFWKKENPSPSSGNLKYIVSWMGVE